MVRVYINRTIATLFLIQIVVMAYVFCYKNGERFLYNILPFMITLGIYVISFVCAIRYVASMNYRRWLMFVICLFAFSLRIECWGIYFKNFAGPQVEVGYSDQLGNVFWNVKLLAVNILNGYNSADKNFLFSVNLIGVLFFLIVLYNKPLNVQKF